MCISDWRPDNLPTIEALVCALLSISLVLVGSFNVFIFFVAHLASTASSCHKPDSIRELQAVARIHVQLRPLACYSPLSVMPCYRVFTHHAFGVSFIRKHNIVLPLSSLNCFTIETA